MSNNSGQEKTEQPTDRRKKEARNKGTVAKSVDMISAVVFVSILMTLPSVMSKGFQGFSQGFQTSLRVGALEPSMANVNRVASAALIPMIPPLIIITAVAMGVGLAGNFAQVGFNLSGEAMKPNFNKLNPATGLKRLFSKSSGINPSRDGLQIFLAAYRIQDIFVRTIVCHAVCANRQIEHAPPAFLSNPSTYAPRASTTVVRA